MKNKQGQITAGILIVMFMIIVIALAIIGAIGQQRDVIVNKQNAVNDSYNLSSIGCYIGNTVNTTDVDCNLTVLNPPTGYLQQNCPLSSIVVKNYNGTALTNNTDYKIFPVIGVIAMQNTTATNSSNSYQTIRIDYTYCRQGYDPDSNSRTVFDMILLFGAIALILVIAGFGLKEWLNI
jgi:hypothetical protein